MDSAWHGVRRPTRPNERLPDSKEAIVFLTSRDGFGPIPASPTGLGESTREGKSGACGKTGRASLSRSFFTCPRCPRPSLGKGLRVFAYPSRGFPRSRSWHSGVPRLRRVQPPLVRAAWRGGEIPSARVPSAGLANPSGVERADVRDRARFLVGHHHDEQVLDHRRLTLAVDIDLLGLQVVDDVLDESHGAFQEQTTGR